MTETDLFVALALLLAGVAMGILVMICLGIKRNDRDAEPTDEASRRRDMLPV